ncbi:MAG: site-specific integrase [Ruminiclostridium sp.]|nr:site-specific integrase [Ruminiclostridium sp.]
MATAKKLPSGSYRVRVYDNETKKYKSFTADTKKAAELAAQEWLNGRTKKKSYNLNITVGEAVSEYIASKENILSPSSIRGYEVIRKNALGGIEDIKLSRLTEKELQKWVNANSESYAPKTIKSQFGLITAALRQNKINLDFGDILLPRIEKREAVIPDEKQISQILHIVEGTSVELPVTIAVTLGLRQSEIAALKWSDYNGQTLKIHAAKVPNKENRYVIKNTTKSQASTREIEVGELLKVRLDRAERTSEYISPMLPSSVLRKFSHLCEKNGLPHFTMHGQRHGNASLMLAQGVPDKYAMQRLGQSSPNMIKDIYQHLYDSKQKQVAETVSDAFSDIYAMKYDTNE